jgi:acyl-coenzyme A thioesterase PaaI-like protein
MTLSLQEQYTPWSACFGCGPANEQGLRIGSFLDGDALVADWEPDARYEAIHGFINGGVVATLLDCHSAWTAAWHLKERLGVDTLPLAVTAELSVTYLRPTPVDVTLHVRAHVTEASDRKAIVEGEASSDGVARVRSRGVFVVTGEFAPEAGSIGPEGHG